jgi:hypothetical protein
MSKNRSSFLKRDREARKREKQVAKKQRREDRKRVDQEVDNASGAAAPDGAAQNDSPAEQPDHDSQP